MGILKRIRESGKPPVMPDNEPLSVTGRGHVNGFLNLEELNVDLQGRQGLEIYDRMYKTDGDCRQVVRMLANPITAGTWEIEPAGGALATQEALDDAAFVRWALFENMTPNLRGHLVELLPCLFRWGFSPFEKVWEVTEYEGEQVTVIRSLQLRHARTVYRWKQDRWNNLEAIEQYLPVPRAQVVAGPNVVMPGDPVLTGPSDDPTIQDDSAITDAGLPTNTADTTDTRAASFRQTVWLPMSNLVYYRMDPEGDNWEGTSLLRPAYKHWLMKDAIERMDAIAQEKEALGIPICYPAMGATPDQLSAMEQILAGIRANSQGFVVMPGPKAASTGGSSGGSFGQGWLIEYLKPGEKGTGRDPHPSLAYHTDKIAAAFVAEFIRVGHSLTGGTRSVAETQMDPFLVGVEAIAGLIEDVLNAQIVAPLIAYNRPKAKVPPRLKMSLIDSTTLSQLADFILKLVQVGALIPDQILEDFLRARADLPPADSESVDERDGLDSTLRREILMGKNGGGGAPSGTNGPAGSETGGSASGTKGVDNKDKSPGGAQQPAAKPGPPTSAHEALTRKAVSDSTSLSSADDYLGPDAPPLMPGSQRVRWRPQAFYELNCDLDGIEDHFDAAPDRLTNLCGMTMTSLARQMADEYPKRTTTHPGIETHVHRILDDAYEFGAQTVSREIDRHAQNQGYALATFTAPSRADVKERAGHAAQQVADSMHHAVAHAHMQGHDLARKQRAGEKAGEAALRQVARSHVAAAFNQGREDRILDAASADNGVTWGVRYTAILDRNTCDHCRDADDGVVRALDDPVRLARKPPNPDCESTASGKGNQCRCFEIPEPMEG